MVNVVRQAWASALVLLADPGLVAFVAQSGYLSRLQLGDRELVLRRQLLARRSHVAARCLDRENLGHDLLAVLAAVCIVVDIR